MKHFFSRLGSPYAISLRVWLWSSPITIIGTAFTYGSQVFFEFTLEVLALGLMSHLAVGVLSVIASWTYLRKASWREPKPILVLSTYALMGVARGLLASFVVLLWDLPAEADFPGRVASGIWIFMYWAVLLTLVLESSERYKSALSRLDQKLAEISQFSNQREEELKSLRTKILDQVEKTLSPALNSATTAFDLERLSRQIISPESISMLRVRLDKSQSMKASAQKLNLRLAIRRTLGRKFPALQISLVASLGLALPMITRGGTPGIAQFIINLVAITVVLAAIGIAKRRQRLLGGFFAMVSAFACFSVAIYWETETTNAEVSIFSLSVGTWLISTFLVLMHSLGQQRGEALESLRGKLIELGLLESKLQQELALERQELVQLIHSEVQGRLRAAAIMAKTAGTKADMEKLKQECIAALSAGHRSQSNSQFIEEMKILWEPALALNINFDASALEMTEADPYLRKALQTVLREVIVNAVKHGGATQVTIGIRGQGLELAVEAINNGRLEISNRTGLGTKVFDEMCSSWSLSDSQEGLVFQGRFAALQQQLS
jgi:hypothetical protein